MQKSPDLLVAEILKEETDIAIVPSNLAAQAFNKNLSYKIVGTSTWGTMYLTIELFKKLRIVENKTCILVTHDIDEALSLGDKIVIFSNKPTIVKEIIENTTILNKNDEEKIKLGVLIKNKLST